MVGTRIRRSYLLLAGCLVLPLLSSCRGAGLATVEGKVIVDGQPASAGRVIFRSADGKSTVFAMIERDGSYHAMDVPCDVMKVTVAGLTKWERIRLQRGPKGKTTSDSEARAEEIESSPKIPEKFQDPNASGLSLTVQPGNNVYKIEITSEKD